MENSKNVEKKHSLEKERRCQKQPPRETLPLR